jgi:predicted nucleic acid-binding protein
MAWIWARIMVACDSAGQATSPTDAWVAAAALRYDTPLLTNNIKHFEAAERLCGLKLCRW